MKLCRTGVILVFTCVLVHPLCVGSVKDSSEFQITSELHDQKWPAIYENIVVWMDSRNGNWDIYGFNLATGEEFQITKIVNLDTLEKLAVDWWGDKPSEVDLIFSDRKSVRINLSDIRGKEKEDLIPLLREFLDSQECRNCAP